VGGDGAEHPAAATAALRRRPPCPRLGLLHTPEREPARPAATTCPRSAARRPNSASSRDLPIPASPVIPTARDRPASVCSNTRSRSNNSASRPTSGGALAPMPRRPYAEHPGPSRSTPRLSQAQRDRDRRDAPVDAVWTCPPLALGGTSGSWVRLVVTVAADDQQQHRLRVLLFDGCESGGVDASCPPKAAVRTRLLVSTAPAARGR
jgi:hypothetical protein